MKLTVNNHPAVTSDTAKENFQGAIKELRMAAP